LTDGTAIPVRAPDRPPTLRHRGQRRQGGPPGPPTEHLPVPVRHPRRRSAGPGGPGRGAHRRFRTHPSIGSDFDFCAIATDLISWPPRRRAGDRSHPGGCRDRDAVGSGPVSGSRGEDGGVGAAELASQCPAEGDAGFARTPRSALPGRGRRSRRSLGHVRGPRPGRSRPPARAAGTPRRPGDRMAGSGPREQVIVQALAPAQRTGTPTPWRAAAHFRGLLGAGTPRSCRSCRDTAGRRTAQTSSPRFLLR
jgi:hypothetical protein